MKSIDDELNMFELEQPLHERALTYAVLPEAEEVASVVVGQHLGVSTDGIFNRVAYRLISGTKKRRLTPKRRSRQY